MKKLLIFGLTFVLSILLFMGTAIAERPTYDGPFGPNSFRSWRMMSSQRFVEMGVRCVILTNPDMDHALWAVEIFIGVEMRNGYPFFYILGYTLHNKHASPARPSDLYKPRHFIVNKVMEHYDEIFHGGFVPGRIKKLERDYNQAQSIKLLYFQEQKALGNL